MTNMLRYPFAFQHGRDKFAYVLLYYNHLALKLPTSFVAPKNCDYLANY